MMRPRPYVQTVLGLAFLLNSCALLSQPTGPLIQADELDELSGLAVSQADPSLLWGHNDSGDRARLFRIGLDGEDLGNLDLPGAGAVDWEDIASFTWKGEPALLVGDVGDNKGTRDHLTLYAVRDPGARGAALKLLWKLDFRYPDGPRDCESVAVDPVDNAVILLSKRDHPQRLYRIPLPKNETATRGVAVAEALGSVDMLPRARLGDLVKNPLYDVLDGPTALDIARSGRFALVMTYKDALLFHRGEGQSWREAFAGTPETVKLPRLKQGEALAISADEASILVSGEGAHPPLVRVLLLPPPLPAPLSEN